MKRVLKRNFSVSFRDTHPQNGIKTYRPAPTVILLDIVFGMVIVDFEKLVRKNLTRKCGLYYNIGGACKEVCYEVEKEM